MKIWFVFLTSLSLAALSSAELRITEFLAINSSGPVDKDGSYSPWIEIQNFSSEPINLKDWYLTDDAGELTKWKFPSRSVPAGQRLVVHTSGKDFTSLFSVEIHTSFTFNDNDDYLALVQPDGQTVEHSYHPPKQSRGVSFGLIEESLDTSYFTVPTQGAPNSSAVAGIAEDPQFSIERGYFEDAFEVEITTTTEGGTILYTTNGTAPSKGTIFTGNIGTPYAGPITIDKTTVLRAVVIHPALAPSEIETKTYLFLDDIIRQSTMRTTITESAEFAPQMTSALTAVPSISLVLTDPSKFNNETELSTSVEWLNPDGTPGFQVDAGASWFGGYFTNFPKKNFRLYFRRRHGEPNLQYPVFRGFENGRAAVEEFDVLNLRTGSHDMVERGAYLSNRFTDDTLIEMGHAAPHGRFVHLYINGTYWGQYHLRERWNDAFGAAYHGGEEDEYEAINGNNEGDNFLLGEPYDGTGEFWQETLALANSETPFSALQNHVDLANYIDLMLLWLSGNSESEFQAIGSKTLGVPFTFYLKDADGFLRPVGNRLSNRGPGNILSELRTENDPDFVMLLADRIHRHYVQPGGAFTPEANIARLQRRVDEVHLSFIAEAARWNYRTPSSFLSFHQNLVAQHFPNLTPTVLNYFKQAGWYGDHPIAPDLNQYGGQVDEGFLCVLKAGTIFSPQPGEILYTIDGSDPRLSGGERAESALVYDRSGPGIEIDSAVSINARTLHEGEWSPLTQASFYVGKQPAPGDLVITEIHYRPAAPSNAEEDAGFTARSDFEFVELYNTTDAALNLAEIIVSDGIDFRFSNGTTSRIPAGGFGLIVLNRAAFELRYGDDLPIVGEFADGKLSDEGETIQLKLLDGTILTDLTYHNELPWPEEADGQGFSLSLRDPSQFDTINSPESWTISREVGGSPGRLEGTDPSTDTDEDGDGFSAFLEQALGTSDSDPTSGPDRIQLSAKPHTDNGETQLYWNFSVLRDETITGIEFKIETSTDLQNWEEANPDFTPIGTTGNLLEWRSVQPISESTNHFIRLRVSGEAD